MSRRPTRGSRALGLLTLAVLFAATLLTASTASADTTFPPGTGDFTVSVTVDGNTYNYPAGGPGPTIPAEDGDVATISIADAPGGPSVNFSRLRARQCAGDRAVSNQTEFNPQIVNRCSSVKLGTGSNNAFVDSGPVAPGTTSLSISFTIGEGTAPDVVSQFDGETYPGFDCGLDAPCKIVVNAEVTTAPGSSNYLGFGLDFGSTPPPSDTILIDCDQVGGTASVKPGLSSVAVDGTAIATKGPLVAGTDPLKPVAGQRNCTGLLATPGDGGTPDDVGNLTKVSGKLVGSATCNLIADPPITNPLDPLDGKLSLTFANNDPATLKPYSSSTYVRVGGGDDPLLPDELRINKGIVTKGVGVGADVYGSFMFAPYSTVKGDFDNNPATKPTVRPDQSFLDANGVLVSGAGSAALGGECIAGLTTLGTVFFATDGTGLLGGTLDSSIGLSLPA